MTFTSQADWKALTAAEQWELFQMRESGMESRDAEIARLREEVSQHDANWQRQSEVDALAGAVNARLRESHTRLIDALEWTLSTTPSPCRCIGDHVCERHAALAAAKEVA